MRALVVVRMAVLSAVLCIIVACSGQTAQVPQSEATYEPGLNHDSIFLSFGPASSDVYVFNPPAVTVTSTIRIARGSSGLTYVDDAGNLFTGLFNAGPILLYRPPYLNAPTTIRVPKYFRAFSIVERTSGPLFLSGTIWKGSRLRGVVVIIEPPYDDNSARRTQITLPPDMQAPFGVTIAANGELLLPVCCDQSGNSVVLRYLPPYTGPPQFNLKVPGEVKAVYAIGNGNLVMFSSKRGGGGTIFVDPAPHRSPPVATLTFAGVPPAPTAMGFPNHRFFVISGKHVYVVDPPYKKIAGELNIDRSVQPSSLAATRYGTIYVLLEKIVSAGNFHQGFGISAFSAPYAAAKWATAIAGDPNNSLPRTLSVLARQK
jgi:hypothetical protein